MNVESHLVTSFVSGAGRIMPAQRRVKRKRGNGCGAATENCLHSGSVSAPNPKAFPYLLPLQQEEREMPYRRVKGRDTWNYCHNCSKWPTSGYDEQSSKPTTGELCNECRSKDANGTCTR